MTTTAVSPVPITAVTPAAVAAAPLQAFSGTAPRAIDEIRKVYVDTGGGAALVPEVLERARDAHSALHRYFEWDDTLAAEAHRLVQAENLVRRVHVMVVPEGQTDPVRVRAFIATRDLRDAAVTMGDTAIADAPPGSYRALGDVTGSPAYEAATLRQIESDLKRLQYKYRLHASLFTTVVQGLAANSQ